MKKFTLTSLLILATLGSAAAATGTIAPTFGPQQAERWVRVCYYSGTAGSTPMYCRYVWR